MQIFDFDTVHNRIGTGAIKYEQNPSRSPQSVIPMRIADMDFKALPAVTEDSTRATEHGIFGYTLTDSEYDELIVSWYTRRMKWKIRPEWNGYRKRPA